MWRDKGSTLVGYAV